MSFLNKTVQFMFITSLASTSLQLTGFAMQPDSTLQRERAQELLAIRLLDASSSGNREAIESLIGNGADANCQFQGETPLELAIAYGQHEAVKALLQHGADANHPDDHDRTPVHQAAGYGYHQIIETLIQHGAEFNSHDRYGNTPLHRAALDGRHHVVDTLLQHGADVNSLTSFGERTPLDYAAAQGHIQVIVKLLEYGANAHLNERFMRFGRRHEQVLKILDRERDFPLHSAAALGHAERVKSMLQNGADINQLDQEGHAPIELAANDEIRTILGNQAVPQILVLMKILPGDLVRTTAEMMGPGSAALFNQMN